MGRYHDWASYDECLREARRYWAAGRLEECTLRDFRSTYQPSKDQRDEGDRPAQHQKAGRRPNLRGSGKQVNNNKRKPNRELLIGRLDDADYPVERRSRDKKRAPTLPLAHVRQTLPRRPFEIELGVLFNGRSAYTLGG